MDGVSLNWFYFAVVKNRGMTSRPSASSFRQRIALPTPLSRLGALRQACPANGHMRYKTLFGSGYTGLGIISFKVNPSGAS